MSPTFFAYIVFGAGLLCSDTSAIYWQLFFCLFGTAAALSLTFLGDAPITPAVLFMPFLVVRALRRQNFHSAARQVPRAGFYLGALVLWAVLSAALVPRMLQGAVSILTVDRITGTGGVVSMPLRPVSGNITQPAYAIGGLCEFLAMYALLRRPGAMLHFQNAVLLLGFMNCLAGVLNLVEFYTGMPSLLAYTRNASYAIFEAYEERGLMRIQGTFPETSGFAHFTVPLFAFAFTLWLERVRPVYSGGVAFGSLALLVFSTSGTAYTSLSLYAVLLGLDLGRRALARRSFPRQLALLAGTLTVALLLAAAFVFETRLASRITEVVDHFIVNKMSSGSGVTRAQWNAQAWQNFLDTYGLGVGVGSARGSSYLLVLLSNGGLIGTLLFGAFFTCVLSPPRTPCDDAHVGRAARQGSLAMMLASVVSTATFDLGLLFYALAAASVVKASTLASSHRLRTLKRSEQRQGADDPCPA